MFIVILFIFLGITAGYVLRTRIKSKTAGTTVAKWSSRLTTWLCQHEFVPTSSLAHIEE